MQKASTSAMVIIVMAVAATAGTLGIGTTTTMITAYAQTSQPPVTSNDECLPGSVVHCIDDDEENPPPNSNEDCLPGSEVHCIDDDDNHNNLRDLFELDVDELLQLDVDDLLERFGHDN
jgi:hypothetical protein